MYSYTDDQINAIREAIEKMLDKTRDNLQELDTICNPDYLKGRAKYPLSAIVYTGFDPDQQILPGLTIQKIQYGKGRFMPELYNSEVTVQLYSDTADFCENDEVKNKVDAFGERFEVIQFWIDRETYHLIRLEQISFDGFTDSGRVKINHRRDLL